MSSICYLPFECFPILCNIYCRTQESIEITALISKQQYLVAIKVKQQHLVAIKVKQQHLVAIKVKSLINTK